MKKSKKKICYLYFIDKQTGANIIFLLGSFNSCTNPWIYLCFSGTLLKELRRQYCCFKVSLCFKSVLSTQFFEDNTVQVTMLGKYSRFGMFNGKMFFR